MGRAEVSISIEVQRELIDQAKQELMTEFEERLNLVSRILDLPVTPNKSEVREILGIGDSTLDFLIANGATPMIWGKSTVRFERADLLIAFNNTKIKLNKEGKR